MTPFRVGQKVVCVDGSPHGGYSPFPAGLDLEGLVEGSVYTVRWTGIALGVPAIRLYEIKRRTNRIMNAESVYAAARFRPAVERPTDISIFKEMLITEDA